MNFDKIVLNKKIKNYKELCALIDEKVKGGNSKKAQMKEIERYLKLEREGDGFYVREIYKKPLKNPNKRIVYNEYIQKLILDLLVRELEINKDCFQTYISIGRFLQSICLINRNYSFCRDYIAELSELLEVESDSIYDFYLASYSNLKQALESGLKQLRNKSLVIWNNETIVNIYENERVEHRPATHQEKKLILKCEKQILKKMGYSSKSSVMLGRKFKQYQTEVNEILYEKTKINYYYEAHSVVFIDTILEEHKELTYLLAEEERRLTQAELNQKVIDKLHEVAENRLNRTIEANDVTFGRAKTALVQKLHRDTEFCQNIDKVTKALIAVDSPDIKDEVVKIRERNNKK